MSAQTSFSRSELRLDLAKRLGHLQTIWGFDASNGAAQLGDNASQEKTIAYGEFALLCDLWEDYA